MNARQKRERSWQQWIKSGKSIFRQGKTVSRAARELAGILFRPKRRR